MFEQMTGIVSVPHQSRRTVAMELSLLIGTRVALAMN
jgi:hypothetical protein